MKRIDIFPCDGIVEISVRHGNPLKGDSLRAANLEASPLVDLHSVFATSVDPGEASRAPHGWITRATQAFPLVFRVDFKRPTCIGALKVAWVQELWLAHHMARILAQMDSNFPARGA